MPILIKHSGNAAPAMVGAYGGGQGRRQAEDTRQALSLAEQEAAQKRGIAAQAAATAKGQTFQSEQAVLARTFQGNQAELGRKFSADQAGIGRTFQADQAQAGRDFQQDMAFDSSERAAALAEQNHNLDVQAKQAEYTQKQMDEFNRLQDVRDAIAKHPGLTDEERADMYLQVDEQQAGIKPLPRMKKPSEWPEGQGVGQVWTSEDGGAVFTRDPKGAVKKIYEPPTNRLTAKDVIDWAGAGTKVLTVSKPDGKGGEVIVPPKPEELEAWIESMAKLTRKLNGEKEPEQAATWDSEYNRQAVDQKFPPPTKPVISPSDTAQQARAKERSYAADMAKWRATNDARMKGEPIPEGGAPLVPDAVREAAGVDSNRLNIEGLGLEDFEKKPSSPQGNQQGSDPSPDVIKVSTKAEYAGLASGTFYMKPDGIIRRKP